MGKRRRSQHTRAKDTKWWIVFYTHDDEPLPREWKKINITAASVHLFTPIAYRGSQVARQNAMIYNKMLPYHERALVFYGSARPATVTEWSVFDDD